MTSLSEYLGKSNETDWSDHIFNHVCSALSNLDVELIKAVPPGGNWSDIPEPIAAKSQRVQQIRASGGRTTYYGRMRGDLPSYTISTFFNRPGNGSFIHPNEERLISLREAARLQSFPDSFIFLGSVSSMYKQIGNAVPPILGQVLGGLIPSGSVLDLFCGAGGLSLGLSQAAHSVVCASDLNRNMLETYSFNHPDTSIIRANIRESDDMERIIAATKARLNGNRLNLIAGGPPCQGFSTAGKWTATDRRNSLPFKLLDIVELLEPSYVLIENVLGLRFLQTGKYLDSILHRLAELGYTTSVFTMRAEEYGVPQRRRRVFVIGSIDGQVYQAPSGYFSAYSVSRTSNSVKYESPEKAAPITVSEAISDLPPLNGSYGLAFQEYSPVTSLTCYQKLMRGLISYDEFLVERAEQG